MTTIAPRNSFRRAFACWPSRIGAAALLTLGLSLGAEAVTDAGASAAPSAVALTAD